MPNIKVWYNEAGKTLGTNTSKIPGQAGVDYTAGDLSVGYGCAGDPNLIGPEKSAIACGGKEMLQVPPDQTHRDVPQVWRTVQA